MSNLEEYLWNEYQNDQPDYFNVMGGLESIMPLLDSGMLQRDAVNRSGGYQNPFTPFFDRQRHAGNMLGSDFMEVLGAAGPSEPPPVRQPLIWDTWFSGPLGARVQQELSEGASENEIVEALRNDYTEGKISPDDLFPLVGANLDDSNIPDWSGFRTVLSNARREMAQRDLEHEVALAEYAARPRYGFEEVGGYSPDAALAEYLEQTMPEIRSAEEADMRRAYTRFLLDEQTANRESTQRETSSGGVAREVADTAREAVEDVPNRLLDRLKDVGLGFVGGVPVRAYQFGRDLPGRVRNIAENPFNTMGGGGQSGPLGTIVDEGLRAARNRGGEGSSRVSRPSQTFEQFKAGRAGSGRTEEQVARAFRTGQKKAAGPRWEEGGGLREVRGQSQPTPDTAARLQEAALMIELLKRL